MPVSSYPRVTVQGTGTAQNTQNGQALMIVNPSTGQYEAATAATFGGGGGGGDATAANQATQITEAQTTNLGLGDISLFTQGTRDNLFDAVSGLSNAETTSLIFSETYTSNVKLEVIRKFSAFNTYYSKVFQDHEGGNAITIDGAVKIVFNQDTEVSSLIDLNGNNVTANYISSTQTKKEVKVGSEFICNLAISDDKFDEITLGGTGGVFTAYYLQNPDV